MFQQAGRINKDHKNTDTQKMQNVLFEWRNVLEKAAYIYKYELLLKFTLRIWNF